MARARLRASARPGRPKRPNRWPRLFLARHTPDVLLRHNGCGAHSVTSILLRSRRSAAALQVTLRLVAETAGRQRRRVPVLASERHRGSRTTVSGFADLQEQAAILKVRATPFGVGLLSPRPTAPLAL